MTSDHVSGFVRLFPSTAETGRGATDWHGTWGTAQVQARSQP